MFTALKFPTILTATKFPTGMFTALKFPTVLTATKFPTVLTATILTLWATIGTIVMSGCVQR